MAKKQYKNVFTIMEKVKKGELDFSGSSRFTSIIGSYKKPELVEPYIHYIDAYRLNEFVKKAFIPGYSASGSNHGALTQTAEKIVKMKGREQWHFSVEEMTEAYQSIPSSLKNDIFNMFNKPIDKIDFKARNEKNQMRYKLLELANDPSLKILTEGSNVKSGMFTQSMMTYLTYFMLRLKKQDQEAHEEMKNQLNQPDGDGNDDDQDGDQDDQAQGQSGSGKGSGKNQQKIEKAIDKALKQTRDQLEREMQDAAQHINELTENIGEEELEEAWNKNTGIGGMTKHEIERALESLKKIKMNDSVLKNNIKMILDKSKNYFSGQERITHESLFESGNFDGLEDYALLHPKLRNLFPEDITTRNVERKGKINLYIDISGSMSEGCGVKDLDGRGLSKLEFAKAIALVMKKNNMLNKLYSFNQDIHPLKTTDFAIASLDDMGGTSISKVVQHVIKSQENSLVLTDAEDRCGIYTDKVFFLGVKGSMFSYFSDHVLADYHQNQMSVFDGERILSVDKNGYTIKG